MKKTKDIIIFMIILMSMILITPTISQAALQSNGNTPVRKQFDNWICIIREMQQAGGTLGLTDTIEYENEEKYLTSNNPNVDVHMEKNTEYGAMAILSASSYGNPNPIGDDNSTTGNKTGVIIGQNEFTATAFNTFTYAADNFKKAVSRYKNIYSYDKGIIQGINMKTGDATLETYNWHANNNDGYSADPGSAVIIRTWQGGSIFGYGSFPLSASYGGVYSNKTWYTRAVIVVGTGI